MSKENFKEKEKLVMGPRCMPDTKTDWQTECRSYCDFDFDIINNRQLIYFTYVNADACMSKMNKNTFTVQRQHNSFHPNCSSFVACWGLWFGSISFNCVQNLFWYIRNGNKYRRTLVAFKFYGSRK
jgi:hypothetical protein